MGAMNPKTDKIVIESKDNFYGLEHPDIKVIGSFIPPSKEEMQQQRALQLAFMKAQARAMNPFWMPFWLIWVVLIFVFSISCVYLLTFFI